MQNNFLLILEKNYDNMYLAYGKENKNNCDEKNFSNNSIDFQLFKSLFLELFFLYQQ